MLPACVPEKTGEAACNSDSHDDPSQKNGTHVLRLLLFKDDNFGRGRLVGAAKRTQVYALADNDQT
jgi:hypothetical protein